jgi:Xaa-Pro aminopeptidase
MSSPEQRPVLLFGESYHHPNIFYRSGFLAPDPVVLVDNGGDDTTLWTSKLEEGRARKQATVGRVRCSEELGLSEMLKKAGSEQDAWSLLLQAVCKEHGLNAVDVESDFPVLYADTLRLADVDVRPRADLYRRERRIKTPPELQAIEQTENAGMEALQRAIDVIAQADIGSDGLLYRDGKPLSGDDLIFTVESRLLELGCTTNGSICAGGPDSADPHKDTSVVLRVGLPIVLDIFPFHKTTRYWGDMTRTVVRGTPPPEVERMWEAVREAQQLGVDRIKPGVNGRDVHYAICDVFKKHCYGSLAKPYRDIQSDARFIHGTGHGLGLEIHEFPRVSDVDVILEPGDVVTVEPGLYDPRLGGIRIEDLVVVTETGCRNLTPLPKVFRLD